MIILSGLLSALMAVPGLFQGRNMDRLAIEEGIHPILPYGRTPLFISLFVLSILVMATGWFVYKQFSALEKSQLMLIILIVCGMVVFAYRQIIYRMYEGYLHNGLILIILLGILLAGFGAFRNWQEYKELRNIQP